MTETINGLHSCKPGNDPVVGQVQLFVIEHRTGKNNKPYIKIKRANEENGGTPHRILAAEPTGYTDKFGNISFNIEVEASSSQPSAFQQTKATMQPQDFIDGSQPSMNAPQSPPHAQQGEDGVTEARKHLMQSCNLLNLCIAAVNKAIAPNVPEIAQTSEFFQAQVATLFIEASRAGYVFKMPDTPIKNGH